MKINEYVELFIAKSQEMHLVQCWSESYKDVDSAFSHCIMEDGEVFFLREQARQLWDYWQYKHKIAHKETQALQEELNALKAQLKDGVIVPREPTTHQIDYCQTMKFRKGIGSSHKYEDIFVYKAMIEAVESHD